MEPDARQTQILSRARPIRVAFLIDVTDESHSILDSIFEFCFSIWGGRFSLVVPCANGQPLSAFVAWLKVFDPDFIYSYVDLPLSEEEELHRLFYPSEIQRHPIDRKDRKPNYFPELSVSPLDIATLIPIAGAATSFDGIRKIELVNAMGRMAKDRFITDSFGLPQPHLQTWTRGVLADFASTTWLVASEDAQPRQQHIRSSETALSDVSALLSHMTHNNQVLSVAHLSALRTPRVELNNARWSESFNMVVGGSVEDRILYWNARLLMPSWRANTKVDLCIPKACFEDQQFVNALREFMNYRNFIRGRNNSGPSRATLRSISLANDELEKIISKLKEGQNWISYSSEHIENIEECLPEPESIRHAGALVEEYGFRSPSLWSETYSTGEEIRLTAPEPDHLRHAPSASINLSSGSWAVDLDIERTIDHSPYSNIRHRWRLPRSIRVTRAFLRSYQFSRPLGEIVNPRVSNGGFLTVYAAPQATLPGINLPDDLQAIKIGLQEGRDWNPIKRDQNRKEPSQVCYEASQSSAGRFFWGVYQLFGDLNTARSVLLHEFWRKQLENFGATDQRTDVRHAGMTAKLIQRIGLHPLDLSDPEQLHTLADITLQAADAQRTKIPALKWPRFEEDFKLLCDRFYNANPQVIEETDRQEETSRHIGQLAESVQNLCRLGVLHQGYEHRCRKCLHRSWVGISNLAKSLVCEVCQDAQSAPVNDPWQFRLNEFLRTALQRYGIGPLFWALSRFQHQNSKSFWFTGPLDIYFDRTAANSRKTETDIDLTMIDNGLVRMCEVKQSERQFRDPERLAAIMKRLKPDIATIAVMETKSETLLRKYGKFKQALAGTGVTPELVTLEENDIEAHPYV